MKDWLRRFVREFGERQRDERRLWRAMAERDLAGVIEVLDRGTYPETTRYTNELVTPLMCAARLGWEEMVQGLVEHGARVNFRGEGGGTALSAAAYHGHVEVARYLLSCGADPNMCSDEGETMLAKAHRGLAPDRRDAMVALLKEAGAKE